MLDIPGLRNDFPKGSYRLVRHGFPFLIMGKQFRFPPLESKMHHTLHNLHSLHTQENITESRNEGQDHHSILLHTSLKYALESTIFAANLTNEILPI